MSFDDTRGYLKLDDWLNICLYLYPRYCESPELIHLILTDDPEFLYIPGDVNCERDVAYLSKYGFTPWKGCFKRPHKLKR